MKYQYGISSSMDRLKLVVIVSSAIISFVFIMALGIPLAYFIGNRTIEEANMVLTACLVMVTSVYAFTVFMKWLGGSG